MPIDPNIALGYRGIEVPNPLAGMAQVTQIQNALQQQRMGNIQMENALREQGRKRDLETIMSQLAPDAPITERISALNKRGFINEGMALAREHATLSEASRKARSAELQNIGTQAKLVGQILGAAKDQPSFDAATAQLVKLGIFDQSDLQALGPTYDPARVQPFVDRAIDAGKRQELAISGRRAAAAETSAGAAASQAMTARDKFDWEKAHPGFTLQDTAQGIMKVDKRTGAAVPFTVNGQPMQSRTAPQVIQGPNGPMIVQPSTGTAQPVMQPPAAPGGTATPVSAPLTAGEREWRGAVNRGEFTGSFVDWKKQTEPKRFEGTVESERAKSLQREADEVSAAATSAARTLPALEVQAGILNSGFRTGWGTEVQNAAASVLSSLGVKDAEKFSTKAELFLSQTQSAVNDALAKQKGAQSDSDAKRASQIYTRLGNTPETNQFLVKMATAVARRDLEKKAFYDDWFKANKSYEGVDSAWQQGPGGKSIFDTPELQPYRLNSATPRAGGGQVVGGRTATAPAPAAPAPAPAGRAKFLGFE